MMRRCQRFATEARLILLQAIEDNGLGFEDFSDGSNQLKLQRRAKGGGIILCLISNFTSALMVIKYSNFLYAKVVRVERGLQGLLTRTRQNLLSPDV